MKVAILIRIFAVLPLGLRRILGSTAGWLFSFVPTRDRAIGVLQLRRFLDGRTTIREVYANFGRVALESLDLKPILDHWERDISCEDWPEIEAFVAEGRPVLALSGHLGNWELLGAYMARRGLPIATVAQRAKRAAFQDSLADVRDRNGVEIILRDDSGGARALVRQMRAKKIIAVLIDQDTLVRGVFVPFFGEPAHTPDALVELAHRNKSILVTAFIVREPGDKFRIEVKRIPDGTPLEEVFTIYHRRLEEMITRYPKQWVWFHKRWRTQAEGKRLSSREYLQRLKATASRSGAAALVTAAAMMFGSCVIRTPDHLRDAEELLRQGKSEEAVRAYEAHIQSRLALDERPEWENPYFYLVMIGDIRLQDGKTTDALTIYEDAEKKGVFPLLIADRFRAVATWYEKRGEYDQAVKILEQYRGRDPLLFDMTLDRLGKERTAREESQIILPDE